MTCAGLLSIRFHDLRHAFGTHCVSAGVPLRTLQERLRHRDFTTTLIYADYAPNPHEAELVEQAFRLRTHSLSLRKCCRDGRYDQSMSKAELYAQSIR